MELGYNTNPRFTQWVVQHGLLQSSFTLIDVGVQGGIHPRWNSLGTALKVHGFDPLAEAIAPLARSGRPGHEYHAVGLGDTDGERDFFVPDIKPAASFFPREVAQDQARMSIDPSNWQRTQTRRVPIRKLDTLMANGSIGRADVLKIDCEGFEPAVLKGAQRFLATSGVLAIESEIGFSSIHWPQTHFLAVYEQLLPSGFRLADLAFARVPFAGYFARARELGRESAAASSVSPPAIFNILFARNLALATAPPSSDEVLKSAMIFELYGMLDVAYDVLQLFRSIIPEAVPLQDGADLLIPPS